MITSIDYKTEVQKAKKGKKEISNLSFGILWLVSGLILLCLSLQNGLYGFNQSSGLFGAVVLAVLFGAGDYAFSCISNLWFSKWAGFFAVIAGALLALLSFTAGLSFMVQLGHQNDLGTSRVGQLQAELETNRKLFEEHGLTKTANRMRLIQSEIEVETARTGENVASQNAIYHKISLWSGYSYEATSLVIRAFWIAVMILCSFSLACLKGAVWCPWKESLVGKAIHAKQKAELKALERQVALQARISEVHSKLTQAPKLELVSPKKLQADSKPVQANQHKAIEEFKAKAKKQAPAKPRKPRKAPSKRGSGKSRRVAPTIDQLEMLVLSGEVKPSKSNFIKEGMGTSKACEALKTLAARQVIEKVGNRYKVAVVQ